MSCAAPTSGSCTGTTFTDLGSNVYPAHLTIANNRIYWISESGSTRLIQTCPAPRAVRADIRRPCSRARAGLRSDIGISGLAVDASNAYVTAFTGGVVRIPLTDAETSNAASATEVQPSAYGTSTKSISTARRSGGASRTTARFCSVQPPTARASRTSPRIEKAPWASARRQRRCTGSTAATRTAEAASSRARGCSGVGTSRATRPRVVALRGAELRAPHRAIPRQRSAACRARRPDTTCANAAETGAPAGAIASPSRSGEHPARCSARSMTGARECSLGGNPNSCGAWRLPGSVAWADGRAPQRQAAVATERRLGTDLASTRGCTEWPTQQKARARAAPREDRSRRVGHVRAFPAVPARSARRAPAA